MTVVRSTTVDAIGKAEEITEAVIAEVAQEAAVTKVAQEAAIDVVAEATVTAEVVPKGDAAIVVRGTDQANFCEQR